MSNLILFFVVCFNFLTVLCGLSQGYGTSYTTATTADITSTDNIIPVVSTTGFAVSDFAWIGGERVAYTGTDATHFNGVTRGVADQNNQGGIATAHPSGTQVYTEDLNALNSMLGFNYSSLQLTYGNPVAFAMATFAYVGAIPRFVFWNVGFMQGSGWSMIKVIILYPLSAAFVVAFLFFLVQMVWMLKPNII